MGENFGGSLIYGKNLPNIQVNNCTFTDNIDSGDNPHAWKFENWNDTFSTWQWLTEKVNIIGCNNLVYFENLLMISISDSLIEANRCSQESIIIVLGIYDYTVFQNITMAHNVFSIINGGALTLNPRMITAEGIPDTEDKMPVIRESKFINNTNLNELGNGAVALYAAFPYAQYAVKLDVIDSTFQENNGGKSGAIFWYGVSLII